MELLNKLEIGNIFVKHALAIDANSFDNSSIAYTRQIMPRVYYPAQLFETEQLFEAFVQDLEEKSISEITDRLGLSWLFIKTQDWLTLVGPYHTPSDKTQDVLSILRGNGIDSLKANSLKMYINSFATVNSDVVTEVAYAYVLAIYGNTEDTLFNRVRIGASSQPVKLQEDTMMTQPFATVEYTHEIETLYMNAIAQGNTAEAVLLLRQLTLRTGNLISNTSSQNQLKAAVAGSAIARTSTRIAGKQAGVPSPAIDHLTSEYAKRVLDAATPDEIGALTLEMAERCCDLVRQYKLRPYSPKIRKAIHFVLLNLGSQITVEHIAKAVEVSPNHLSTAFHKETGEKLLAFIQRLRLEKAAQLLTFTSQQIQEVSTSVGILDNNYFTKIFKRRYGLTPKEYRKNPSHEMAMPFK